MLGMGFLNNTSFYVAGGRANIMQFYRIDGSNNSITIKANSALAERKSFNAISVHEKKLALRSLEKMEGWYDYCILPEAGKFMPLTLQIRFYTLLTGM